MYETRTTRTDRKTKRNALAKHKTQLVDKTRNLRKTMYKWTENHVVKVTRDSEKTLSLSLSLSIYYSLVFFLTL